MVEVFVTPQVSVVQEIAVTPTVITQDIFVQPVTTIELLVPGLTGPRGAAGATGPAAAVGEQYSYAGPLSSISQAHTLGRVPAVAVFLNGEQIGVSVIANATTVIIEFPFPQYLIRIILT